MQLGRAVRHKLFRAGELLLHSTPHPLVHCKALLLLSNLAEAGDGAESKDLSTQALNLCGAYSMAQDARVRTAAFHALLTIHKRGVKLDVSMYPVFCTALTDDYEGVRCEALKLISTLAKTEPEFQVEVEGDETGETKRLVDDVFSRTCQAINDVQESVRCLAARIIGNMQVLKEAMTIQYSNYSGCFCGFPGPDPRQEVDVEHACEEIGPRAHEHSDQQWGVEQWPEVG